MRLYRNVLFPYRDICPYNPLKRDSQSKATQKLYNRISAALNKTLKQAYRDMDTIKDELVRIATLKDTEEKHFDEICH